MAVVQYVRDCVVSNTYIHSIDTIVSEYIVSHSPASAARQRCRARQAASDSAVDMTIIR